MPLEDCWDDGGKEERRKKRNMDVRKRRQIDKWKEPK